MDATRQLDQAAKRKSCAWLSPRATVLIRRIRRNRRSNGIAAPKVILAASEDQNVQTWLPTLFPEFKSLSNRRANEGLPEGRWHFADQLHLGNAY